MLGRYPRPCLDGNTSKGKLHSTQSNGTVLFPSSEDEKPVLLPPHQIVIGFDVPSEKSKSFQAQTSKSPRSVLEPDLLGFDVHHRQSQSLRSPLSVLGSLLSGPHKGACTGGAALFLKVAADAEKASNVTSAHSTYSKTGHVSSNGDGAGAYHSSLKTDYLEYHVHGNVTGVESKSVTSTRSDFVAVGRAQPWNHGNYVTGVESKSVTSTRPDYLEYHVHGNVTGVESKSVTSTRSDYVAVGRAQPWNHGRMEHAFSRSGTGPCHKTFLGRDCEADESEDGDDGNSHDKSMFSLASPVSDYLRYSRPSVDFLSKCFLCRRHLARGKDIYMYRGDRAFCSQECRHHQIVVDKSKKRRPVYAACL